MRPEDPIRKNTRQSPDRGGFALIVALSLMAFILLLLLSLSTLVNLETRTATVHKQTLEARNNALMGLRVALGELQKTAGPDQRVTARADILGPPATDWIGNRPNIENPQWTGVWRQNTANEPSDANPNPTPEPQLLTWLVSGMDGKSENELMDEVESDLNRNSTTFDFHASGCAQVLVPHDGEGGVVVPVVRVGDGGYAYWIADEGVKANAARIDDLHGETNTSSHGYAVRATVGQRFGIENVGMAPGGSRYGDLYPINNTMAGNVCVFSELSLLSDAPNAASEALKNHRHDLTVYSKGLLTDAWNGGFKVDLSRGLDDDPLTGDLYTAASRPAWDDKPVPQWELFRDFYSMPSQVSGGSISVRTPTDTSVGTYPIIVRANLYSGIYLEATKYDAAGDPEEYQLYLSFWVGFSMWNPYNVSLNAQNYVFSINPFAYTTNLTLPNGDNVNITIPYSVSDGTGTWSTQIRFATAEPVGFAPGEVKVFSTQPGSAASSAPGSPYIVDANGDQWYAGLSDEAKCVRSGYDEEEMILLKITRDGNPASFDGILTKAQMTSSGGAPRFTIRQRGAPSLMVYDASGHYINSLVMGYDVTTTTTAYLGNNGAISCSGGPMESRREGTYRLLADLNIRAIPDSTFSEYQVGQSPAIIAAGRSWAGSSVTANYPIATNGAGNGYWGRSDAANGGQTSVVMFDLPKEPLLSLGQLQHLDLRPGWYQNNTAARGTVYNREDSNVPSFQVGNSRANMWTEVDQRDFVYRINEALWDSYFFSGIPSAYTDWEDPLPNPRIQVWDFDSGVADDLADINSRDAAASKLVIDAPFNVNSTSVEAWKALLSSMGGFIDSPDDAAETLDAPFVGISWEPGMEGLESTEMGTGNVDRLYNGYRSLTEDELQSLAERVVEEVKVRGPFLSLAQFVNRTLENKDTRLPGNGDMSLNYGEWVGDRHDSRLKGTLQAANDATDTDDDGAPDINEIVRVADADTPYGDAPAPRNFGSSGLPAAQGVVAPGSFGHDPAANSSSADSPFRASSNRPTDGFSGLNTNSDNVEDNPWVAGYGLASTDAPGFLSQMDILTAIAPVITVRSDTFAIRAYGEINNPLTGEIVAQACLEAVVQRLPEYVVSYENSPDESGSDLSDTNARFGRRFVVVSFRWLNDSLL